MDNPDFWNVLSDDSGCSSGEIYLPIIEYYPDSKGDSLSKKTPRHEESKPGLNRSRKKIIISLKQLDGPQISKPKEGGSASYPNDQKLIETSGNISKNTFKREEFKLGTNRKKPRIKHTQNWVTSSGISYTNMDRSSSVPDDPKPIEKPGTIDARNYLDNKPKHDKSKPCPNLKIPRIINSQNQLAGTRILKWNESSASNPGDPKSIMTLLTVDAGNISKHTSRREKSQLGPYRTIPRIMVPRKKFTGFQMPYLKDKSTLSDPDDPEPIKITEIVDAKNDLNNTSIHDESKPGRKWSGIIISPEQLSGLQNLKPKEGGSISYPNDHNLIETPGIVGAGNVSKNMSEREESELGPNRKKHKISHTQTCFTGSGSSNTNVERSSSDPHDPKSIEKPGTIDARNSLNNKSKHDESKQGPNRKGPRNMSSPNQFTDPQILKSKESLASNPGFPESIKTPVIVDAGNISKHTLERKQFQLGPIRKKPKMTHTQNRFMSTRISYTNKEGSSSDHHDSEPIEMPETVDARNSSINTSKHDEFKPGPNRSRFMPRIIRLQKLLADSQILKSKERDSESYPNDHQLIGTPGTIDAGNVSKNTSERDESKLGPNRKKPRISYSNVEQSSFDPDDPEPIDNPGNINARYSSNNKSKRDESKPGPNRKVPRIFISQNQFAGPRIQKSKESSASIPDDPETVKTPVTVDVGNISKHKSGREESHLGPNRTLPRITVPRKKFTGFRIPYPVEESTLSDPDDPPERIETTGIVDTPQGNGWMNTGVGFTASPDAGNICRIVRVYSLKDEVVGSGLLAKNLSQSVLIKKGPRLICVENVNGH